MIDRSRDLARAARHFFAIAKTAWRHGHYREARQWVSQAVALAGHAGLVSLKSEAQILAADLARRGETGAAS
jgi:HEPN domain-containing protein